MTLKSTFITLVATPAYLYWHHNDRIVHCVGGGLKGIHTAIACSAWISPLKHMAPRNDD